MEEIGHKQKYTPLLCKSIKVVAVKVNTDSVYAFWMLYL